MSRICVGSRAHNLCNARGVVQGYLAHMKTPTPLGPPQGLGMVLLQGPRGRRFLLGEVQGLLEIKDTHRPWGGPMLLGIGLP